KKDAIPGFVNETWAKINKPGVYRGVCAELCGRDHGFMPIVVKAVSEEEFAAWLAQKKGVAVASAVPVPVAVAPMPASQPVAVMTPSPTPTNIALEAQPASLSKDELMKKGEAVYKANCAACHQAEGQGLPPNFPALKGSKLANGPAKDHIQQTLTGRNLMPPFPQLKDEELAAVITYERQSWGNKASIVQPADVAAARK
ncbi:MAG: c-type cytochrome, partial [Dongiaceae bacterium]